MAMIKLPEIADPHSIKTPPSLPEPESSARTLRRWTESNNINKLSYQSLAVERRHWDLLARKVYGDNNDILDGPWTRQFRSESTGRAVAEDGSMIGGAIVTFADFSLSALSGLGVFGAIFAVVGIGSSVTKYHSKKKLKERLKKIKDQLEPINTRERSVKREVFLRLDVSVGLGTPHGAWAEPRKSKRQS